MLLIIVLILLPTLNINQSYYLATMKLFSPCAPPSTVVHYFSPQVNKTLAIRQASIWLHSRWITIQVKQPKNVEALSN